VFVTYLKLYLPKFVGETKVNHKNIR